MAKIKRKATAGTCNTPFNMNIPEDWHQALGDLAELHGVSKGEIARGCMEYFLNGALPYLETRRKAERKEQKRVLSKPWAVGGFRR